MARASLTVTICLVIAVISGTSASSTPPLQLLLDDDIQWRDYSTSEYPANALSAAVEGAVVVELQLDRRGNVTGARSRAGHPLLTGAALKSARQWRFYPGVRRRAILVYNFVISRDCAPSFAHHATVTHSNVVRVEGCLSGAETVSPPASTRRRAVQVAPGLAYPAAARPAQGAVVVDVSIDAEGRVVGADPLSGPAALVSSAVDNVARWIFSPGTPTRETIVYDFRIAGRCREGARFRFELEHEHLASISACSTVGDATAPPADVGGDEFETMTFEDLDYPPDALAANIQGAVVVATTQNGQGRVTAATRISGAPELATAAIQNARHRTYAGPTPYLLYIFTIAGRCDARAPSLSRVLDPRVTEISVCAGPTPAPPASALPDEPRVSRSTPVTSPALAAAARVSGPVFLDVAVNGAGDVVGVTTLHGHPLLTADAMANAVRWRFAPGGANRAKMVYYFSRAEGFCGGTGSAFMKLISPTIVRVDGCSRLVQSSRF